MSVDDVMKVNKLAQELLRQGIVSSRDDAVKRAQEMLDKKIVGNDMQIKETETKQNIAVEGDSVEKLKNMFERNKEYTERQLAGYKNALIALEKEINALKQQISDMRARSVVQQRPTEERRAESSSSSGQSGQQPQSTGNRAAHPRVGKFNPEQVSVEKIFYYGNK